MWGLWLSITMASRWWALIARRECILDILTFLVRVFPLFPLLRMFLSTVLNNILHSTTQQPRLSWWFSGWIRSRWTRKTFVHCEFSCILVNILLGNIIPWDETDSMFVISSFPFSSVVWALIPRIFLVRNAFCLQSLLAWEETHSHLLHFFLPWTADPRCSVTIASKEFKGAADGRVNLMGKVTLGKEVVHRDHLLLFSIVN